MADIQYIDLNNVPNKDSLLGSESFPIADQSDLNWSKTDLNAVKDFVNTDILVELDTKADIDNVYTKVDVDTQLASKASLVHTHAIDDVVSLQGTLDSKANVDSVYSKVDTDTLLASKAPLVHTHAIDDVVNLQDSLNTKANVDSVYTKQESDTLLASKAPLVHTHSIADVINLQSQLDQLNVIRSYNRIFAKTTATNETIPANTSIRILDRVTLQAGGVVTDDFTFVAGTNAFIKELLPNSLLYKQIAIRLTFGHTASFGNTQLEVQIWRNTATPTLVASFTNLNISDSDARGVSSVMITNVKDITDPYVINGYYLIVKNLTGTVFTYSSLQVAMFINRDRI